MGVESLQPFDWYRMYVGSLTPLILLEIAFRTVFMYLYVLLLVRLIGKRGIGDMTTFDQIIVIAVGSATGDPMLMPEVPLLQAMVVIGILVYLERLLARLTQRSSTIEKVAESTPSLLVREGRIVEEWLERERMTVGELMSLLRLNGIRDLGEVERAYLEPTGTLSVFRNPEGTTPPVRSTFPPRHVEEDPR